MFRNMAGMFRVVWSLSNLVIYMWDQRDQGTSLLNHLIRTLHTCFLS